MEAIPPAAIRVVLCTCPDAGVAQQLAAGLVEARLAACVNVLPQIRSTYRWQGAVHDEAESLMVIKTGAERFADLQAWLVEHHPYDVPEVLALPVEQGLPAYLEWVTRETS